MRSNGLYDVMRYRPRSILRLILLGFGLATLPLVVALVTAVFYVEHVTDQSQQTVYGSANSIRASQMLVDEIGAMERNARQYSVLLDPGLYTVYNKRREELLQTIGMLRGLRLSAGQQAQLDRFVDREQHVHDLIKDNKPESAESNVTMAGFSELANDARAIQRDSGEQVAKSVTALRESAERAQRWLAWQAAAVIPAVAVITGLFIYLITLPISQLDQAIRRLGAGDFRTPISIAGPRDLEDLGHRLQWMGERLLELENQKVMWLRHMSHELKTPLATIREGTELLNERVVGVLNPQQAEVVDLLRESSIQLQSLIEGLLNFSIYRSIEPPVRGELVALDEVIEQVLNEQRLVMRAKELQLTTDLMTLTIKGNRDQLRTIVDNLVSNAVKYAPAGTRLWLRLCKDGDVVVIEVKDEGPGIPHAEQGLVFEAFFRGKAQPQGHVKGTGLGLSIAREFARLHRGDVHVIEQEKGASLRVTLPVA